LPKIVGGHRERRLHPHALHGGRRQDDKGHEQHIGQIQHRRDVDIVVELILFLRAF
jgi:hypothetical protein